MDMKYSDKLESVENLQLVDKVKDARDVAILKSLPMEKLSSDDMLGVYQTLMKRNMNERDQIFEIAQGFPQMRRTLNKEGLNTAEMLMDEKLVKEFS